MFQKKDKLLRDERELVITELSERLKDMVYSHGEKFISDLAKKHGDAWLNQRSDDSYTVSFSIDFIAGDIQQIVARHRRTKEG